MGPNVLMRNGHIMLKPDLFGVKFSRFLKLIFEHIIALDS